MITIVEKDNKLLVYQDDKLIAEDSSKRITFTDINLNRTLDTTINQLIEASDFSHKSGRYIEIRRMNESS